MVTQGDFDSSAVNRIRDLGGDALVSRIATVFNDFAAARVADAVGGVEGGDLTSVAAAAHALRSSAANIGAIRLLGIATDLERVARAGDSRAAASLAWPLRDAFDHAREYVSGFALRGAA